jgi:CoA:oxalate CoA-transferase
MANVSSVGAAIDRRALEGLKVVELGEFVAAPYCGKLLADMGAQVIKVEPAGRGDYARSHGPFPDDLPDPEKSGLFLFLNTNKQSITLNLQSPAGVRLLHELIQKADVLIAHRRPSELQQLGLSAAELKERYPHLVATLIAPFGQTGPLSEWRGDALIASHSSGSAYINPAEGVADLESEPPLKAPGQFVDLTSGLIAAIDTMSAVIAKKRYGAGARIDLSEQEAIATTVRTELAAYTYEKALPGRIKVRKRSGGMLYACKGGYVVMSGTGEGFWPGLVKMMGSPEWTKEEWCKDGISRNQNIERVNAGITEWSSQLSPFDVERAAIEHRVPCAVVRNVSDLANDEQLAARGFFVTADHPRAGKLTYLGAPYKLSETPWQLRSTAPLLGEHNEAVYCGELGYSREDLVRMRRAGII